MFRMFDESVLVIASFFAYLVVEPVGIKQPQSAGPAFHSNDDSLK